MNLKNKFDIIYEDKEILVVYKMAGLLSISNNKVNLNNLYHYVREYLNSKNEKAFIVHRLDKDTSGIMIFAKNFKVKNELQKEFEQHIVERKYECVIKEKIEINRSFTIKQFLYLNKKSQIVLTTKNKKIGKESITNFTCVKQNELGSVLDISLITGRQNQIKVALSSNNFTLLGDRKYSNDYSTKRLMLNAYSLKFPNNSPIKKKEFVSKTLWI